MEQRITRAKRAIAEQPYRSKLRRRSARRSSRGRRGDDLSALQRGLFRKRRHGAHARRVVRRSDPTRTPAVATLPERARSDGPDGAAAVTACTRAGAARSRQRNRPARGSGSQLVESTDDRRGARARRKGVATSRAGHLSGAGCNRRRALARQARARIRTGRRSTRCTGCWKSCNLRRSSRSIAQLPSPRCAARLLLSK